jgi:hypothetical protein
MIFADADPVAAAWILLVAETKASPRPRSTAASSNTWAETSFRQESPVTSLVAVPSESTTNTRPALSLVFQRLKALIKSKPDQGTVTDGSTFPAASVSITSCRL